MLTRLLAYRPSGLHNLFTSFYLCSNDLIVVIMYSGTRRTSSRQSTLSSTHPSGKHSLKVISPANSLQFSAFCSSSQGLFTLGCCDYSYTQADGKAIKTETCLVAWKSTFHWRDIGNLQVINVRNGRNFHMEEQMSSYLCLTCDSQLTHLYMFKEL